MAVADLLPSSTGRMAVSAVVPSFGAPSAGTVSSGSSSTALLAIVFALRVLRFFMAAGAADVFRFFFFPAAPFTAAAAAAEGFRVLGITNLVVRQFAVVAME